MLIIFFDAYPYRMMSSSLWLTSFKEPFLSARLKAKFSSKGCVQTCNVRGLNWFTIFALTEWCHGDSKITVRSIISIWINDFFLIIIEIVMGIRLRF